MTVKENLSKVLGALAAVPRDESGYGWTDGQTIAKETGLEPADINDAASLLVESGLARWLPGGLSSAPWQFVFVAIVPRGRALFEQNRSGSGSPCEPSTINYNINAHSFSGVVANEVSGSTTVVSHQNSIGFDPEAVRHVVDEIKKHKGDLALSAGDELSIDREIEVINSQLATQTPNRSRIKAALQSVNGIVEGGVKAGLQTAVGAGIIHLVGVVIAAL